MYESISNQSRNNSISLWYIIQFYKINLINLSRGDIYVLNYYMDNLIYLLQEILSKNKKIKLS